MNDTALSLLVVLVVGAGLGWHLGRRPRKTAYVVLAALAVPALPLAALMLAGVLRNDTLGWVAGLSLMVLAMAALPLALGAAAGWVVSRARRLRRGAQAAGVGMPGVTGAAPAPAPASAGMPSPAPPEAGLPRAAPAPGRAGLLLAMAGVGAGFWVVLAVGFRINGGGPALLQQGLWPAAAGLAALLLVGARQLLRWRAAHRARRHGTHPGTHCASHHNAHHRAHHTAPQAPPGTDRATYALDRTATACCAHLAPLEAALRAGGHPLRWAGPGVVQADCGIDAQALQGSPLQPRVVVHEAWHSRDRQGDDEPVARLRCTVCGSQLWVLHPQVAGAAPVFTPAGRA